MTLNEITSLPPDTSATAPGHMIGFGAGWRAAMEQVRSCAPDPECPDWFVAAMDRLADRIRYMTDDGPTVHVSETDRCGELIADAIRHTLRP